ncbi:uncharacterized protein LOC113859826 [Abrus precatorius]|uniref:Uncharacterized protein LOC113859826 n=1 Tax=Abrus precatorius TaxID=3816 RepID=A0A8B8KWM2_ABRPR|nr:uncharacterized protein LOC113859826 [Abrus precatorius]
MTIRFWKDSWIPNINNLASFALYPLNEDELDDPMTLFSNLVCWNWPKIRQILPMHICNLIAGCDPPLLTNDNDQVFWNLEGNGKFSLRSAYSLLSNYNHENLGRNHNFNLIWDCKALPRFSVFLWKVAHGRLLTNAERFNRNMTSSSLCPRCNEAPETVIHVLRDC